MNASPAMSFSRSKGGSLGFSAVAADVEEHEFIDSFFVEDPHRIDRVPTYFGSLNLERLDEPLTAQQQDRDDARSIHLLCTLRRRA